MRHEPAYNWSSIFHTVKTADWACHYVRERDCATSQCVDSAIQNYTQRLADTKLDFNQTAEALKFLVHFVGDIHQPLHSGFVTDSDGGGIKGTFFNVTNDLHDVWDTAMIERRLRDFDNEPARFYDYLRFQIERGEYRDRVLQWRYCFPASNQTEYGACSYDWIQESLQIDCLTAYWSEQNTVLSVQSGFDLGRIYYERHIEIVEMRLAQAGVRLAHVINNAIAARRRNGGATEGKFIKRLFKSMA